MASTTSLAGASVNSTLTYVKTTAFNATSFLVPSPRDLLYLFPRMAARAGAFVTDDLPGAFENIFGGPFAGRVIEEATAGDGILGPAAAATAANVMAGAAQAEPLMPDGGFFTFFQYFGLHQLRTFGGIFTYLTSKWALGCFTVSVVLKRTAIYASTRRNLQLNWQVRAALRIVPILVLMSLCQTLTRSIRCQMSPDFSLMRYGDPNKYTKLDFSGEGGLLYQVTNTALFFESDIESCAAVDMISTENRPVEFPDGSLAILWPSFQAFSLAQFVETIISSLQNMAPATETGMTLFEHSLAFAEAEAMISHQLGLGAWSKSPSSKTSSESSEKPSKLVTRSFLVSRFNVPPEVLLVSLISCLNNLASQILGVFGKQAKYRLINTGIWGLAFMGAFAWGFFKSSLDQGLDSGIFRFPTVCVVGFIPHTLILMGIFLCATIYTLALSITMVSPPDSFPRNMTLKERFWRAQQNMQANIPLSTLRVDMKEDFYTSLLRTGITALTAASEAVFLNEGQRIKIGHWTWVEEDQMQQITRLDPKPVQGSKGSDSKPNDSPQRAPSHSVTNVDPKLLHGGYARERSTETLKVKNNRSVRENDGVGAHLRGARYMLAFNFFAGIFWLLTGWAALFTLRAFALVGIRRRPQWLSSLLAEQVMRNEKSANRSDDQPRELEFWILSEDGELALPRDNNVDVAAEVKQRLRVTERVWGTTEEAQLDSKLYSWFVHGGWWGERDDSGDYLQTFPDEDATSVVTTSTYTTDDNELFGSGPPTPTQRDFAFESIRELSPEDDLTFAPADLARLLNPQDSEAREEARMLAAHLSSNKPVTRSQYRGGNSPSKNSILASTRYRPPGFAPSNPSGRLTRDEEAEILEYLIVKFRERGRQTSGSARADWASGGDGMGAGGPQCVVCQTAPRTILAWPCRCLSLCDECRISLAMNNFGSCVCCRQEVVAFSRLYVP
jgi:Zinc finger, C3HC4 type (RING finger)